MLLKIKCDSGICLVRSDCVRRAISWF